MSKVLRSGYGEGIYIGGDPEIFLSSYGRILGSERVIPSKEEVAKQIKINTRGNWDPRIKRDGVQVEIELAPMSCRASGGSNLAGQIRQLQQKLLREHPSVQIDWRQVVEVSKEELSNLSKDSQLLLCEPSKNVYEPDRSVEAPPGFLKRSAGGHVHIGWDGVQGAFDPHAPPVNGKYPIKDDFTLKQDPERLVKLLDVLVGNTMVLIDRSPDAVVRRELYGRAGEYRTPSHGLEYRVLSNFWLRDYRLCSLVWGLVRFGASIVFHSTCGDLKYENGKERDSWGYYQRIYSFKDPTWEADKELMAHIDLEVVKDAINSNDPKLALRTWKIVREFLEAYTVGAAEAGDGAIPIVASTLEDFDYFVEKGLDHWFPPQNTLLQWLCHTGGTNSGWEGFLTGIVRGQRLASLGKEQKAA